MPDDKRSLHDAHPSSNERVPPTFVPRLSYDYSAGILAIYDRLMGKVSDVIDLDGLMESYPELYFTPSEVEELTTGRPSKRTHKRKMSLCQGDTRSRRSSPYTQTTHSDRSTPSSIPYDSDRSSPSDFHDGADVVTLSPTNSIDSTITVSAFRDMIRGSAGVSDPYADPSIVNANSHGTAHSRIDWTKVEARSPTSSLFVRLKTDYVAAQNRDHTTVPSHVYHPNRSIPSPTDHWNPAPPHNAHTTVPSHGFYPNRPTSSPAQHWEPTHPHYAHNTVPPHVFHPNRPTPSPAQHWEPTHPHYAHNTVPPHVFHPNRPTSSPAQLWEPAPSHNVRTTVPSNVFHPNRFTPAPAQLWEPAPSHNVRTTVPSHVFHPNEPTPSSTNAQPTLPNNDHDGYVSVRSKKRKRQPTITDPSLLSSQSTAADPSSTPLPSYSLLTTLSTSYDDYTPQNNPSINAHAYDDVYSHSKAPGTPEFPEDFMDPE